MLLAAASSVVLIGGDSYAATAYSEAELNTQVQKFYAYKIIEACSDSIRTHKGNAVNYYDIVRETYKDSQGDKQECSADNIDNQLKILDITIAGGGWSRAVRNALGVRSGDKCRDFNTSDAPVECLKTGDKAEIAHLLRGYLDLAPGADQPSQAAWFLIWNSGNAFGKCRGVFQSGKPSTTWDKVYAFSNGASTSTMSGGGEWQKESVWATKENLMLGDIERSYSVWAESGSMSCGQIYDGVNRDFEAYVDNHNEYIKAHPDQVDNNKPVDSSAVGGSTTGSSDGGDGADDSTDTCEASLFGFGWIICPGQNLITGFIDILLNMIQGSIKWTLLADKSSELMTPWRTFVNIANVLFAILFMVMIYSMATSTGLSNYSLKKMLPRLIICAIAVNVSFYICAALADLSNIVGAGVKDLLLSGVSEDTDPLSDLAGNALKAVGNLTSGIIGVAAVAITILFFGGTVVMSLAVLILAITVRQVALIVLVVVSPLAFACYLLPNTQKWWRMWFDNYTKMLLVYPMFMTVWGGSRLVSNLAASTGSGFPFVVDVVCAVAPALAIIPCFKAAGGVLGAAVGKIQGNAVLNKGKDLVNFGERAAVGAVTGGIAMKAMASGRFTNGIGGLAVRKAAGYSNDQAKALDDRTMKEAASAASRMSSEQLNEIINNGGNSDPYMYRAAINGKKNFSAEQQGSALNALLKHQGSANRQYIKDVIGNLKEQENGIYDSSVLNEIQKRAENGTLTAADLNARKQEAIDGKAASASRSDVGKMNTDKLKFLNDNASGSAKASFQQRQYEAVQDDKTAHGMSPSAFQAALDGAVAGVNDELANAADENAKNAAAERAESLLNNNPSAASAAGGNNMRTEAATIRNNQLTNSVRALSVAMGAHDINAANNAAAQISAAYGSGLLNQNNINSADTVGQDYARYVNQQYNNDVGAHNGSVSYGTRAGLQIVSNAAWVRDNNAKGRAMTAIDEINNSFRRAVR